MIKRGLKKVLLYAISACVLSGFAASIPVPVIKNSVVVAEASTEMRTYTIDAEKNIVLKYQVNSEGNGINICGLVSTPSEAFSLTIPSKIDNLPVKAIWEYAFEKQVFLQNVVLPDSIVNINQHAFDGCSKLVEINLPQALQGIGDAAFKDCSLLTNVVIPYNNLVRIGKSAFENCRNAHFNAVEYDSKAKKEVSTPDKLVIPEKVTEIGDKAFYNCSNVRELVIKSDGIIGSYAFGNCGNATGSTDGSGERVFEIPEGITTIGSHAFDGCKALDGKLKLPKTLMVLDEYAFQNCYSFTGDLTIPMQDDIKGEHLTTIGRYAFYGCTGFNGKLTIPEGIVEIGDYAFASSTSTFSSFTGDLIIPDTVTSIGQYAFYHCAYLDGILVLPKAIEKISDYAFSGCALLQYSVPSTVYASYLEGKSEAARKSQIDSWVSSNAKTTIETPDSSFKLYGLYIPDTVTSIGQFAFSGCFSLVGRFHLSTSVTSLARGAFQNCSQLTGKLIVPDGFNAIPDYLYDGCASLTGTLDIPSSVTTIGVGAVRGCVGLTGDLVISDNVTRIGQEAFANCTGFTGELVIGTNQNLKEFGKAAFSGCENIGRDTDAGNVIIPTNIKSLSQEVFANCYSIKSFTIGRGLNSDSQDLAVISDDAFKKCSSTLTFYVYENSNVHNWIIKKYIGSLGNAIVEFLKDVKEITLNRTSAEMFEKDTLQLKATVNSDASDKTIKWESDAASVAKVDANGIVTAMRSGTANISAIAGDGSGVIKKCTIKVVSRATAVYLSKTSISINAGETFAVTATVAPATAKQSVKWTSSDTKVATVDAKGNIKGVGAGEAAIRATATDGSGVYQEVKVKVSVKVTGISLNVQKKTLYAGKTYQLKATLNTGATNTRIAWSSSDSSVASVDQTGKITACYKGKCVITATTADGGYKASCTVTVRNMVRTITLSDTNKSLAVGKTYKLKATVNEDAYNKTLKWKSSNKKIATVSSTGKIKAIKTGTVTITATATDGSGIKATCTLNVTKLKLNKTKKSIAVNGSYKLTPKYYPKTVGTGYTWKSSKPSVATVDAAGNIRGLKPGTVTITCKATDGSGAYAKCKVTVVKVKMKKTQLTMKKGGKVTLKATVYPTTIKKGVKWTTSNKSIATVTAKGVVKAKRAGVVTIRATSKDGSKAYAECVITVK